MGYVMVLDGIRNPDFGVPEVQMCKVKVGKNWLCGITCGKLYD